MDIKYNNIFLIGFMGTGKSAVAEKFSELYEWKCRELDSMIEKNEKRSISEIFKMNGEEYFRRIETEILKKTINEDHSIISCGGGTPLKKENVEAMKSHGVVIWLKADPLTVLNRVKGDTGRPLLKGNMNLPYIEAMMNKRKSYYEDASDYAIDTDRLSVNEICGQIMKILLKTEEEYV